jgi:hypothetical protein
MDLTGSLTKKNRHTWISPDPCQTLISPNPFQLIFYLRQINFLFHYLSIQFTSPSYPDLSRVTQDPCNIDYYFGIILDKFSIIFIISELIFKVNFIYLDHTGPLEHLLKYISYNSRKYLFYCSVLNFHVNKI